MNSETSVYNSIAQLSSDDTTSYSVEFLNSLKLSGVPSHKLELKLFRHGQRNPKNMYPKDPYGNLSIYWPDGLGQITNVGIEEQYELGKWVRQRYRDFLPTKYSSKLIYVRSTDHERTLTSAEAHLAGLFPPEGREVWNKQLLWRPIPVHTTWKESDDVLAMEKNCPKYDKLYKDLMNSEYFLSVDEQNRELYSYLSQHSGWNITHFKKAASLFSLLNIETQKNLTLPEWTKGVFPDKLKRFVVLSHASQTYTAELARLKAGTFFDYLITHFESIINKKKEFKMLVLSAHGGTVINVLNSMNLFDYEYPVFGATIIWELRRNHNGYYINMVYKNGDDVKNMVLKGCLFNCYFDHFKNSLSGITADSAKKNKECFSR